MKLLIAAVLMVGFAAHAEDFNSPSNDPNDKANGAVYANYQKQKAQMGGCGATASGDVASGRVINATATETRDSFTRAGQSQRSI